MTLLPVVRSREGAFAYTCHGCGRCCHHKAISVGPYEAARLAGTLGLSTTETLARYVDPQTAALKTAESGACVFLDGGRCTVHEGRPLACRLYPLGWFGAGSGREAFSELAPHPQTEGVYGEDGTVAAYLDAQGTAPYERAAWRYAEVLLRLHAAMEGDGPDPGEPPPLTDVDAAVEADCAARGEPAPSGVEARVNLHLALLHRWLDAAGAPEAPGGDKTGD